MSESTEQLGEEARRAVTVRLWGPNEVGFGGDAGAMARVVVDALQPVVAALVARARAEERKRRFEEVAYWRDQFLRCDREATEASREQQRRLDHQRETTERWRERAETAEARLGEVPADIRAALGMS